jgi:hypothetical protein
MAAGKLRDDPPVERGAVHPTGSRRIAGGTAVEVRDEGRAHRSAPPCSDPALARLVAAWPRLSERTKAAVLGLLDAPEV